MAWREGPVHLPSPARAVMEKLVSCALVENKRESQSPCGAVMEGGVSGSSRLMQSSRDPRPQHTSAHSSWTRQLIQAHSKGKRLSGAKGAGVGGWSMLWLPSSNPFFPPLPHLTLPPNTAPPPFSLDVNFNQFENVLAGTI